MENIKHTIKRCMRIGEIVLWTYPQLKGMMLLCCKMEIYFCLSTNTNGSVQICLDRVILYLYGFYEIL